MCNNELLCEETLRFFNLLSKTHPSQQRALLETVEPDQACAIRECIYIIMHGNIHIPEGIKEGLAPRKQMLQDLADTKVPYKIKKEILSQSGGSILGALIPPAIIAILGLTIFLTNLLCLRFRG